jgi:hypothetical protein
MHVLAVIHRPVREHRADGCPSLPSREPTQDKGLSVSHRTLLHAIAKRATALDEWMFADDELAAAVRGWQVARPRLFVRTYRDPRWDQVGLEPVPPSSGRSR